MYAIYQFVIDINPEEVTTHVLKTIPAMKLNPHKYTSRLLVCTTHGNSVSLTKVKVLHEPIPT